MSDTLRDQLLGLGFKPAPKPAKPSRAPGSGRQPAAHAKPRAQNQPGQPGQTPHRQGPRKQGALARTPHKPRAQGDIDLAKAYAIRSQREKEERIEAERLQQEQARQRRKARARLEALLKDKALNDAAAEIARHFPYGGKIKRIYVNAAQLKALNAGELGVVQLNGRYLLVTAAVLAEAEGVFAQAVALKVDPDAPATEDSTADPKYRVPDDLIW